MYLTREKISKSFLLVAIVIVCVSLIGVILQGVNQFKVGSQLASISQVSNLSHLLVRQQANIFSLLLVKNSGNEELAEALDSFAQQDFVIDATLYSPEGVRLVGSKSALDLKTRLASQAEALQATQQIVEPIFSQQALIGFLRVTFDAQYGQTTQNKVDQLFHSLYGELIILVLAGALLASSLHSFLRKKASPAHNSPKVIEPPVKSQARRFHQRRRVGRVR